MRINHNEQCMLCHNLHRLFGGDESVHQGFVLPDLFHQPRYGRIHALHHDISLHFIHLGAFSIPIARRPRPYPEAYAP